MLCQPIYLDFQKNKYIFAFGNYLLKKIAYINQFKTQYKKGDRIGRP